MSKIRFLGQLSGPTRSENFSLVFESLQIFQKKYPKISVLVKTIAFRALQPLAGLFFGVMLKNRLELEVVKPCIFVFEINPNVFSV